MTHRLCVDREVRIHTTLSHANVVRLQASFEDADAIYLVLDLLTRDLFAALRERGHLSEEGTVLDVLAPLLNALTFLHEQVSSGGEST